MPLFTELDDEALGHVVEIAAPIEHPHGAVLIERGTPGSGLFVIMDGTVGIELRHRTVEAGPGETVGELSLLTDHAARVARVRALTERVRSLAIGGKAQFNDLLQEQPRIAIPMLGTLARRLQDLIEHPDSAAARSKRSPTHSPDHRGHGTSASSTQADRHGSREPARRAELATWLMTAGVVAAIGLGTVYLLANRQSAPAPKAAKTQSAADRNAPASLVAAADAIGFHTSTEPGVGQMEGEQASAAQGPSTSDLLKPGTVAPPFTLKTPQGEAVSLSDYKGKAVLLELFATWCPHCQAEAPHLARLAAQLKPHGVQFVSINADSENAASVFAFHRYFGLPYPALVDQGRPTGSFTQQGASGPVTSAYHLHSYPTFYVIKPDGTVAWASDGEQPDALLRQQAIAATQQA